MTGRGYGVDELMVTVLAEALGNGEQVCNGLSSNIAVCAVQLARMTHAPDLTWIAGGSGLDPARPRLTASSFEWPLWRDAVMYFELDGAFWDYVSSSRFLRTFCVGAAQLDAYGNMNNSVIGEHPDPSVRLPGTAALADVGSLDKRLLCWTTSHSPRTLVERVDFRSGIGYLGGHGERGRLGLGGGPELVVTDLAVFDFEPDTQRMRLTSVHDGVTVDDVLAATGFAPALAEDVTTTAPPTAHQLDLIRNRIDPHGFRKRGFPRDGEPGSKPNRPRRTEAT